MNYSPPNVGLLQDVIRLKRRGSRCVQSRSAPTFPARYSHRRASRGTAEPETPVAEIQVLVSEVADAIGIEHTGRPRLRSNTHHALGLWVAGVLQACVLVFTSGARIYDTNFNTLASTMLPMTLFFGLQFLMMGIAGEYLYRIYTEVLRRPLSTTWTEAHVRHRGDAVRHVSN